LKPIISDSHTVLYPTLPLPLTAFDVVMFNKYKSY